MLCPCPRCARHVRVPSPPQAEAASCPFCGFAGAWPAPTPLAGRLARLGSRAALVFGALEVGVLGCTPAEVPSLPSPPPAPAPSGGTVPSAAPAPPPEPPPAADAGAAVEEPDASFPRATVAIYGAPPPRPPRPKK